MSRIYHRIVVFTVGFLLTTAAESRAQGTCLTVPADPDVQYDSLNVGLLGLVSLQDFGEVRATDIWGYVSPSGREYALIGLHASFGIVEVTDPANPVIVDQIPGPATCWRDIKVFGQFAFGVSDSVGTGLLIIDLSNIDIGRVTLAAESGLGVGFITAHNIALNPDSGFAYLCIANASAGGKFTAVDLSDPLNPQIAGMWEQEGSSVRVHDAQVVNYTQGPFAGREIAFCFCENDGVRIIDVTNKKNMFVISAPAYPNTSYCHQGWLSDDRRFMFVDDELDEADDPDVRSTTTYVFNIEDVENAVFVSSFTTELPSSDHNLMVRGQRLYEANYSTGLRVFDISDMNDIAEVAHLDTYPENDDVGAGSIGTGAWGVYTALPSGLILVSDRNRGLFVLVDTECGTGTVEPGEECDDANTDDGDGCSSTCTLEPGFDCTGEPTVCTEICGDGLIVGTEECDGGVGCTDCLCDADFEPTDPPSVDCRTICGNGSVNPGEECDNGNTNDGDGCSSTCTVEEGWDCIGEPSECTEVCGDGLIVGGEDCDPPDGQCCSDTCTFEAPGTACPDDGNGCTDDQCDGDGTCTHQDNNDPCADDGNECTDDLCSGGTCTHTNEPNGTPCGDASDTGCDNPDTCDGLGACQGNNEPPGTACDDGEECTVDDQCTGLPGNDCMGTYQQRVFADICLPYYDPDCDPPCPQPNLDDILCELDDFANGPAVDGCACDGFRESTDLHPCPEDGGGDGMLGLDDILKMLDAFAGNPHCLDPCP